MHRQLADDTPDRKGVSVVSIEAAATVDVHRDRPELSADDTDRLDSDAMLVRNSRRQQQPGFNRKAHAFFFLEHLSALPLAKPEGMFVKYAVLP
jgi:hypothetical protein